MQAFVPKNRRPKFDLTLKIIDLNNIPLTHGTSYVKWHLPASTSAEHRGRTDKTVVKEHRALWNYSKQLPVRLTVDRNAMLQDSEVHFEVLQEYTSGGRGGDRIVLGNVKLNLAEYAAEDAQDEEGIVERRYLMQDSKVNSTLKVGIGMKLVEGERNFVTPPLKTAMVFGGIAGIMAGEGGDAEDIGHLPNLTTKTREVGELQDMYRRTLAASWAVPAGELPPDQLVEDIFSGGNGGMMPPPGRPNPHYAINTTSSRGGDFEDSTSHSSDVDSLRTVGKSSRLSPSTAGSSHHHHRRQKSSGSHGHSRSHSWNSSGGDNKAAEGSSNGGNNHHNGNGNGTSTSGSGISGRGSIEQQLHHSNDVLKRRGVAKAPRGEVTEFDVRDDLRSWKIETS